ncbi:MAG: glycine zipper domain protein [Xanthomonadaceae bacterium]|nr:glycine zipper domain protein [Xanthomonadaceae bacterium]
MNNNTLAIALASLLVGGVAVAAFQHSRSGPNSFTTAEPAATTTAQTSLAAGDIRPNDQSVNDAGQIQYAQVIDVQPRTERQKLYAQVIGTEPVRETSSVSAPHEVCNDVVVQEQAPRRDPRNIGGTVAGAVIGGLLGNQVGGGTGRKLATVGGAVGGGFAGRAIEQHHAVNKTVSHTEHQCHTVSSTSQSSRVVAYNVTYRNPDGTTGTMRTGSKPGSRISLGNENKTIGYDVTYTFNGHQNTVRMDHKPGDKLPVIDGRVVTQVASASDSNTHG